MTAYLKDEGRLLVMEIDELTDMIDLLRWVTPYSKDPSNALLSVIVYGERDGIKHVNNITSLLRYDALSLVKAIADAQEFKDAENTNILLTGQLSIKRIEMRFLNRIAQKLPPYTREALLDAIVADFYKKYK